MIDIHENICHYRDIILYWVVKKKFNTSSKVNSTNWLLRVIIISRYYKKTLTFLMNDKL